MSSKPVAQLLVDLAVTRSHVPNDNPDREAAFKTLKYAPVLPEECGSVAEARAFCKRFSATTTTNTATPASGCTPRPRSTTAPRARSAPNARSVGQ